MPENEKKTLLKKIVTTTTYAFIRNPFSIVIYALHIEC